MHGGAAVDGPATLRTMKNRFPNPHRATWRQRFVAIARQAAAEPAPPRRPAAGALRARIRVRFAAIASH